MLRKTGLALILSACWISAFGLGLGEIQPRSGLNEPLVAEIPLSGIAPDELENLRVRLAPAEAYARAGIELGDGTAQGLRFDVVQSARGPVLRITSAGSVREPFLEFLIELSWPGGRLLREFTVLLDPPALAPMQAPPVLAQEEPAPAAQRRPVEAAPATPAAPVRPPVRQVESRPPAARSRPASAPTATPPSTPIVTAPAARPTPPAVAAAPPPRSDAKLRRVQRNETAWQIARSVRPTGVSLQQTMQALVAENPQAFIDRNVNLLRAGAELRIPDAAAIGRLVSHEEAVSLTRAQTELFEARRTAAAAPVPASIPAPAAASVAPKSAAASARSEPVAGAEPGRLQLVSAEAQATQRTDTGGEAAEMDRLRSELALTGEALEVQRQEKESLGTRLGTLERQVADLQRLLTLKDEELASMQQRFADGTAAPAPAAAPFAEPQATAAAQASPAAADDDAAGAVPGNAAPTMIDTPSATETAVPAEPLPAGDEPQPRSGLPHPALIATLGVLLLSFALLALQRRRQGMRELAAMPNPGAEAAADVTAPGIASARATTTDWSAHPATLAVEAQAEPEGDALQEADVLLAYARYAQAESLLRGAIAQEPARSDLKQKLLETFYAARDRNQFEDYALELYTQLAIPDADWPEVQRMGRDLAPDNPLFAPTEGAADPGDPRTTGLGAAEYDEVATKLDLARAYLDLGDPDGARSILNEVLAEGSPPQRETAEALLARLTRGAPATS